MTNTTSELKCKILYILQSIDWGKSFKSAAENLDYLLSNGVEKWNKKITETWKPPKLSALYEGKAKTGDDFHYLTGSVCLIKKRNKKFLIKLSKTYLLKKSYGITAGKTNYNRYKSCCQRIVKQYCNYLTNIVVKYYF